MEQFTGLVRRCVEDYDMIQDGDVVAVGLRGGKDSMALLCALTSLRRYYPKKFELIGVTIGLGFPGMDFSPVETLCRDLDIPFTRVETEIGKIIFDYRKEKNPCSLCAKMRRAVLADLCKEYNCKDKNDLHCMLFELESIFQQFHYPKNNHFEQC